MRGSQERHFPRGIWQRPQRNEISAQSLRTNKNGPVGKPEAGHGARGSGIFKDRDSLWREGGRGRAGAARVGEAGCGGPLPSPPCLVRWKGEARGGVRCWKGIHSRGWLSLHPVRIWFSVVLRGSALPRRGGNLSETGDTTQGAGEQRVLWLLQDQHCGGGGMTVGQTFPPSHP